MLIEKPKDNLAGTFLEMARLAMPKKDVRDSYPQWCDSCGKDTDQTVKDEGLDEIYTCKECGHFHAVRVR